MICKFNKIVVIGTDKEQLVKLFDMILSFDDVQINSCFIDEEGTLVLSYFWQDDVPEGVTKYPFTPNAIVLTEQVYAYLSNLPKEAEDKLEWDEYAEEEETAWEVFTHDWNDDGHKVKNHEIHVTIAIKPTLVQYGK